MILKLQITTNKKGDVFEMILKKPRYRVGRRFDNDLRIKESYVSAYHAEIRKDSDDNYTVVDKGSSNGTYVNNVRVKDGEAAPIKDGDFIKFGILKVHVLEHEDSGPKVVSLGERQSATQPVFGGQKTGAVPTSSLLSSATSKVMPEAMAVSAAEDSREVARLKRELEEAEEERSKLSKELFSYKEAQVDKNQRLENKIKLLEKSLQEKEDSEKSEKKERQSASENDARELARITKEFGEKESTYQSEIAALKKELEDSGKKAEDAEKAAKQSGEDQSKHQEIVTELQQQIADLEKAKQEAIEEKRTLTRDAGTMERKLEKVQLEVVSLNEKLKDKSFEAAQAAALAEKFEKNEHTAAESGKKQEADFRKRIVDLESKLEESEKSVANELEAREKAETELAEREKEKSDLLTRIARLEAEGKDWESQSTEKVQTEKDLRKQIAELEKVVREKESSGEKATLALQATIATLESSLQEKSGSGEKAEKAWQAKIAKLEGELKDTAKSGQKTEAELQAKIAQLESELQEKGNVGEKAETELRQQVETLQSELRQHQDQAKKSERTLLALTAEKEKAIDAHEQERDRLQKELADGKSLLSKESETRGELETRLTSLEADLKKAVSEAKAAEEKRKKEIEAAEKARSEWEEKFHLADKELKSGKKSKEGIDKKVVELEDKIKLLGLELAEKDKDRDRVQAESEKNLKKAQSEVEQLRGELAQVGEVKEKLEASEQAKAEIQKQLDDALKEREAGDNLRIAELEVQIAEKETALLDEADRYLDLEKKWQLSQESFTEQLDGAKQERDELTSRLQQEQNEKLTALEEELSAAIRKREELAEEKLKLEESLHAKEHQFENLQDELQEVRVDLQESKKSEKSLKEKFSQEENAWKDRMEKAEARIRELEQSLKTETEAGKSFEDSYQTIKEKLAAVEAGIVEERASHRSELIEWEKKWQEMESANKEMHSEATDLEGIRKAIMRSTRDKEDIIHEINKYSRELKAMKEQHAEMLKGNQALEAQAKELRSGIQVSQTELENLQKIFTQTRSQEERLTLRISTAEKRVNALKHLETELEQTLQRRREENGLSRKEVFKEMPENISNANFAAVGNVAEEAFCRKLVSKLDLLDDLTIRYHNKWRYPKVSEQLTILKESFLDLLKDHSVTSFSLAPGTAISMEDRKRIKLIPSSDVRRKRAASESRVAVGAGVNGNGSTEGGGQTRVVETLRSGYLYRSGGKEVIIRKAEVMVE